MSSFGGSVKLTGESEYKKALRDITSSLKLVSSELKLTNTEFNNGDKTLKQTKNSYDSMSKTLEEQKAKVSSLKEMLAQAEKEYGANNEKVKMFKAQLNNAENQLKQMEDATDKSTKELKEMKEGFDDAGQGALTFGDILKANVLGDVITGGLKTLGSAVLDVGKAFIGIGKQAIDGFADFEQLEGGVKKLFGDEMAETVKANANRAFSTAGMSANEYMETVTGFSASLISSLKGDTVKATELSDMAIRDMSDNANTFGTDLQSLQNAYGGFAKGQFNMLDNLKLGYGGTQEEMKRLLKDAQKISGVKYDISSFADITQAIHVMQEKMQIAGTTSKEASQTIGGSISAMKSSWQNLLTGIADDGADFTGLVNGFVESIVAVANNILPRINVVIDGIIELVVQLTMKILEQLPNILQAGSDIIYRLIDGISTMIPEISFTAFTIIQTFLTSVIEMLPTILQMGIDLLLELVNGISQTLPDLIPTIVDAVILIVETLIDNIDMIIDAGIQLILALADGLIEALPRLIDKAPEIIGKLYTAFANNFPKIVSAGGELIGKLIVGIVGSLGTLLSNVPKIISTIVTGITNGLGAIRDTGKNLVSGIWEGISGSIDWLKSKITGWVGNVTDFLKSLFGIHSPSTLFRDEIGTNLALGVGEGFSASMKDVNKEMASAIQTDYDLNVGANITGSNNLSNSNYNTMVNAFKDALTKVKIELNDREMGTFVTNTMERVVFN